jgi:PAS domain S-box-containing protein
MGSRRGDVLKLNGRYSDLYELVDDAVLFCDPDDGRILDANGRGCEMYGIPKGELVGKRLVDLSADAEREERHLRTVVSEGSSRGFETVHRREDGTTIRVRVNSSLIELEDRRAVLSVSRDLTEHEEAEIALRSSELKYRSLVERIPAVTYIEAPDAGEPEWNLLYVSPQVEDLLGYTPEEWTSDPSLWERVLHPEDREYALAEDVRTEATGEPFNIESRLITRDGLVVWVRDDAVLVRDEEGMPLFWQGIMIDVTERREIEEELRQAEAKYRTLVEQIPAMVYVEDAKGRMVTLYDSPQIEYLLGYPRDTHKKNPDYWVEIIHPDDRERVTTEDARTGATGDRFSQEYRVLARDGRVVWVRDDAVLVRDEEGMPLTWQGVIYDITARRQAEEEIRRLNESLERRVAERTAQLEAYAERLRYSNRELQDFAYVASHDLQEPLRKVLTFGDRLQTRYGDALGEQGRDYLRRMEAAAARMRDLIEDLLTLSRVTTQARPFARVDLTEVAEEVVSDLEAAIEESGGRVELESLPTVDADRPQMRQLFQNLIVNALKFRKEGQPPVVKVRGEVHEERRRAGGNGPLLNELCRIAVEDDGIGFDEEHLERIFVPFQRLHGRNAYEGTGMGLAICRKVVERHGGEITAHSAPGQGATFVVTLPAKQQDGEPQAGRGEFDHHATAGR